MRINPKIKIRSSQLDLKSLFKINIFKNQANYLQIELMVTMINLCNYVLLKMGRLL